MTRSTWSSIVLLLIAGCTERGSVRDGGPGGPRPDGSTSTGDIRIEPADHEVTIAGGTPQSITYRAFIGDREVTGEVEWLSTVAALGTFSANTFTTSNLGGITNIRARLGTADGITRLTIRLERTIVTPGTDPSAPSRFGGTADPTLAPELLYPPDDTMVPPNLGELEFHFDPAPGTDVYQLHVVSAAIDLRIYFGCMEPVAGGCIFTPDRATWDAISAGTRGAGRVTYTLSGAGTSGFGSAASRTITVAEEDITGGLYYWNAAGGRIDRFEFGVRGAVAERFLDQARTGAAICIGCHALSRDGRRIAVGSDIPTTTLQVFDVATRARIFSQGGGAGPFGFPSQPNFYSFNPDATQLVASSAEGIHIRDGNTGNVIAGPFPGTGPGEMPDWSPDGQRIVYVQHPNATPPGLGLYDFSSVTSGSVRTLVWSGGSWVQGPDLAVSRGDNNYYPTFAPDGQWVVFNRSPSNASSMGGDSSMMSHVPDAELWAVHSDGSAPPVHLARVQGSADSWPKFDPTTYLDQGRTIFWFAWSSRRQFGLRLPEGQNPQLWMAAFVPSDAEAGRPEMVYPAFRLPFQSIESGNHIAQWVTRVERMACTSDAECGGEFCIEGRCYEQPPLF